jgi:protein TonB
MHRAFRFAASCLSLGVFRMSDFKQPTSPRRQLANIALVLLIHIGLLYALMTGLGHTMGQVLRGATEVRVIEDIKPADLPPPLPAPPKLLPPAPTFVLPDITVSTPSQSPLRPVPAEPDRPASPKAEERQPAPPLRVAPVIDAARSCTLPQYPAVSIRLGEEGAVDLEFLIDLDGRVADSRIAKTSGHPRLDEAARAALALCRFTPGTVDGKPERSWGHLLYRWTLSDR